MNNLICLDNAVEDEEQQDSMDDNVTGSLQTAMRETETQETKVILAY